METILGAPIESWVIAYFVAIAGFIFVSAMFMLFVGRLQKGKSIHTKKFTYYAIRKNPIMENDNK